MEPDKTTPSPAESELSTQEPQAIQEPQLAHDDAQAPVDALSRTPDDLQQEQVAQAAANIDTSAPAAQVIKKVSPIKRFFRKVNIYILIFALIVVVAGVITVVNFLNSQKAPVQPSVATQSLTQDALKQLANTDATVGSTSQTLTIQGNAIISGQTLARGNLNVAGNLQTGGSIQAPSLTISGASNLGTAQINSLQVATNTAVQGSTTLRDLNVAGTSSFSGPITASQVTVSRLVLSGTGILQVPNHLSFTGPSPSHTINNTVLGNGGTASVSGSDTSGTITINTGNNPSTGCFAHISFQQAYSAQPRVIVSPIGAGAGQSQYYVDRSSTGFSICSANVAPANQTFGFDYFVAG